MGESLVVGVLFPRRQGPGAALRAGRLVVLARDAEGRERPLTLTCLARPGGRGAPGRCRFEHATAIAIEADGDAVATFDPVRGRVRPSQGADPALVAHAVETLRALGPTVRPPAPPRRSTLPPHAQVAG